MDEHENEIKSALTGFGESPIRAYFLCELFFSRLKNMNVYQTVVSVIWSNNAANLLRSVASVTK
jgi:hypothetical protein